MQNTYIRTGFAYPITHWARRAPDPPVGWIALPWSRSLCTIIPRPTIPCRLITLSTVSQVAVPCLLAIKLPRSPHCRFLWFGNPCRRLSKRGLLKCPPVAVPSGSDTSPYECICHPCCVCGRKPLILQRTRTKQRLPYHLAVKTARPDTKLPSVDRKWHTNGAFVSHRTFCNRFL